MPNQDWWLVFKTKKEGNAPKELAGDLKEVKKGLVGAVEGFTGMSIAGLGMAGIIAGVGKELKVALDDTMDYAEQVRDLGRISGATAEDTSRLIQTADDLKVSYETLTAMTKKFRENGLVLTTEELAKASDKYLALQTQQEKNTFAEETLGKAWQEGTKILEVGGDALRKMAAAQSDNLILTQQQVDAARQWEVNTDALSDAWMGVKYTIGNAVIPVLNDLFTAVTKESDVQTRIKDQLKELDTRRQDQAVFAEKYTGALRKEAEAQIAAEQAAQAFADKSAAMDAFYGGAVSGANDFAAANDNVTTSLTDTNIVMQEYTTKLLFNQAAAGLDKDASLLLANSLGLVDQNTLLAMGELEKLRANMVPGEAGARAYAQAVAELNNKIALLKDKTVSVTVNTYYHGAGTVAPSPSELMQGHAAGGSFGYTIPPGFNENFPIAPGHVGSSGEHVDTTVTPAGRSSRGGSPLVGPVYIYSGMDEASFERMLMRVTRK